MHEYFAAANSAAIPIIPLDAVGYSDWLSEQPVSVKNWLSANAFEPKPHQICLIPGGPQGQLGAVVLGLESNDDPYAYSSLPEKLPAGIYRIDAELSPGQMNNAAIGWGMGSYRYTRYRTAAKQVRPQLALDPQVDRQHVDTQLRALAAVRDMINTPAADMMPVNLSKIAGQLAKTHGGHLHNVVGDDLLAHNYPMIHAVGRASVNLPRLLDLTWGKPSDPKLTLIGKGVCFDSGGLDLKTAAGMRLMKKDMGGAAHVLGLADMIMSAQLPVRLRVLVPAVENAVSGNAFRPGDVITTRKKITVEIENTDAEGRLVLCDALAEAGTEQPDLIIDFATLTGAARVALGTELPAFFTNSDSLATGMLRAAEAVREPIWRLPLHQAYRYQLESNVADLSNSSPEAFGGAITAALFLQEFVPEGVEWAHFDINAWNMRTRPGRPKGGEAMGLRAVYAYLYDRFSKPT
jgi:leucyl aminopeptidase